MPKFIKNSIVHTIPYDFDCEKARFANNAVSANWLVNDDTSTYHFSAENVTINSESIPLYNTTATQSFNYNIAPIDPKFDSPETTIGAVKLNNAISDKDYAVQYTINDNQTNYYVYAGTITYDVNGSCTEYMGFFNRQSNSTSIARVPFRFAITLKRKNNNIVTPDFNNAIPIANITKIYNIDYSKLSVSGPTYVLGTCIARVLDQKQYNNEFPITNSKYASREMFFFVDTTTGNIYLIPSNCKFGTSKNSAYHCSYTNDECRRWPCIELSFNTTLYVMFKP